LKQIRYQINSANYIKVPKNLYLDINFNIQCALEFFLHTFLRPAIAAVLVFLYSIKSEELINSGTSIQLVNEAQPLPQFLAHICYGQMAGWIKVPLGTKVGIGHIVLDGTHRLSPRQDNSNFYVF